MSEEGSSGVRGAVSYPPTPNCRIREVHCGNQVRLIVIAIRDIAKGEEITVDYSLTEWGENVAVSVTMTMANTSQCSKLLLYLVILIVCKLLTVYSLDVFVTCLLAWYLIHSCVCVRVLEGLYCHTLM